MNKEEFIKKFYRRKNVNGIDMSELTCVNDVEMYCMECPFSIESPKHCEERIENYLMKKKLEKWKSL
jgi:hypothetical protein